MRDDLPSENDKVVAFKKRPPAPARPPAARGDPDAERARSRANLVALAVVAVLVLAAWLLVQKLGQTSRTEDCLMSGRTNCAPIAVPRGE